MYAVMHVCMHDHDCVYTFKFILEFFYYYIDAAKSGFDYMGVSTDVVFPAGIINGAMRCIDIVIFNDNLFEDDETFTVTLITSSSVVSLGNNVTIVNIIDSGNVT